MKVKAIVSDSLTLAAKSAACTMAAWLSMGQIYDSVMPAGSSLAASYIHIR